MTTTDNSCCRLCGGPTRIRFHKTVRERLKVGYYECSVCRSLQTEQPYWLDEAYSDSLRPFDVFAASRALDLQAKFYLFSCLTRMPANWKWLDWGAGDGLLVRLLRDVGIDAYYHEPMGRNVYAYGFEADLSVKYHVVTAIEVWEHLPDPSIELENIFALQPEYHIATTGMYTGQDESWKYLYAQTGRHVFFYSHDAVTFIAKKYNYDSFVIADKFLVFHRPSIAGWKHKLLRYILSGRSRRIVRTGFSVMRRNSLMASDQENLLRRYEQGELPVEAKRGNASVG